MDTMKRAVLIGYFVLATLSGASSEHNAMPLKQRPTTTSTVLRCTFDVARIGAYAYYLHKHTRPDIYDVSVLYAMVWGAVDLYDLYEAILDRRQGGEDLDDLDDITLVLDRQQETAINKNVERIKTSLLPIVNTALPLASTWLTSNGDHIMALRLQSIASLTRLAEVWVNHPKSTQKRFLGALLLMHVAKTVNDFTMQSKNELLKKMKEPITLPLQTIRQTNGTTDQLILPSTEPQQKDKRPDYADDKKDALTSQQNLKKIGSVKDINTFTKNFIQQLQQQLQEKRRSATRKPLNQQTIKQSGHSNKEQQQGNQPKKLEQPKSLSEKTPGDFCTIQ